MANVDGTWSVVVKSPLGDQKADMTVESNGDSFTGKFTGAMGSADVEDGKVSGDTLTWTLNVTVPMPLNLTCEATVDGDAIRGTVTAGAFGAFPLDGTRA